MSYPTRGRPPPPKITEDRDLLQNRNRRVAENGPPIVRTVPIAPRGRGRGRGRGGRGIGGGSGPMDYRRSSSDVYREDIGRRGNYVPADTYRPGEAFNPPTGPSSRRYSPSRPVAARYYSPPRTYSARIPSTVSSDTLPDRYSPMQFRPDQRDSYHPPPSRADGAATTFSDEPGPSHIHFPPTSYASPAPGYENQQARLDKGKYREIEPGPDPVDTAHARENASTAHQTPDPEVEPAKKLSFRPNRPRVAPPAPAPGPISREDEKVDEIEEDRKPDISLMAEELAFNQLPEHERSEGVLAFRREQLPPDCLSKNKPTRDPARKAFRREQGRELGKLGRTITSTMWRDDGVGFAWKKDGVDVTSSQKEHRKLADAGIKQKTAPSLQATNGGVGTQTPANGNRKTSNPVTQDPASRTSSHAEAASSNNSTSTSTSTSGHQSATAKPPKTKRERTSPPPPPPVQKKKKKPIKATTEPASNTNEQNGTPTLAERMKKPRPPTPPSQQPTSTPTSKPSKTQHAPNKPHTKTRLHPSNPADPNSNPESISNPTLASLQKEMQLKLTAIDNWTNLAEEYPDIADTMGKMIEMTQRKIFELQEQIRGERSRV